MNPSIMYEARGKVKVIFETQTFASGFEKRELVITTSADRYPQDIKFEFLKEKAELLNDLSEGQDVLVNFDIRGNEYNGKYYNNLVAWKVGPDNGGGGAPAQQPARGGQAASPAPQSQAPAQQPASSPSPFDDDEDIPF